MTQIAWVVDDIAAAEQELGRRNGVTRWTRLPDIRFGPDSCLLRDQPADFVAHISLSYIGDLQLELIEPVEGDSIYREFLADRGPGLHHGCWEVQDLATTMAQATDYEVVQSGSMADGEIRFAYLEPGLLGFPVLELAQVGPGMRQFYDGIREACAAAG
jgi:hypothetical protein